MPRELAEYRPKSKEELPMALKMNAAVVEQFGKPLLIREWDIPSPMVGQILVKTEACGVCHTDLHAARGDWLGMAGNPSHFGLKAVSAYEPHRPCRPNKNPFYTE
jgi:hypothetical protein